MSSRDSVLDYLLAHPGWHYGLELVEAGISSRAGIYVHLGSLEEQGYVERRTSSELPPPGFLPRQQYRATGKRIPIDDSEGLQPA